MEVMSKINEMIAVMKANKPNDRSERDRHAAIALTEAEKLYAFYLTFVYQEKSD